ncbi:MAG: zinc ribbon domain-containing protein [Pseudomonadales bacterium]|nr:zinc ribbon domain-containing protein [Pseudomonadales bacterium]
MEVVVFWISLSVIVAIFARKKGRSGIGFFLLSIFFSPLIGFIIALLLAENRGDFESRKLSDGANKKCPHCAELVKAQAKECRYCGKDIKDWPDGAEA